MLPPSVAGALRRCGAEIELCYARRLAAKELQPFAGRHGVCELRRLVQRIRLSNPSDRPNVTTDLVASLTGPRSTVVSVKLPAA
jgi:hypothetical protein